MVEGLTVVLYGSAARVILTADRGAFPRDLNIAYDFAGGGTHAEAEAHVQASQIAQAWADRAGFGRVPIDVVRVRDIENHLDRLTGPHRRHPYVITLHGTFAPIG